jgi:hypothetical protein
VQVHEWPHVTDYTQLSCAYSVLEHMDVLKTSKSYGSIMACAVAHQCGVVNEKQWLFRTTAWCVVDSSLCINANRKLSLVPNAEDVRA